MPATSSASAYALRAPAACAVTGVSLEHTDLLGDTLAAIAREKAGIFREGVPAIAGPVPPEALVALRDGAEGAGAPLHVAREETTLRDATFDEDGLQLDLETPLRRYRDLRLPLYGRHQAGNAATATRLAELFYDEVRASVAPVRDAFAGVRRLAGLRGRFEVLSRPSQGSPLVVADVAHHPDSLAATLRALREHFPGRPGGLTVACGLMRDKDATGFARFLAEAGAEAWPVRLDTERARPPGALAEVLKAQGVPVGPTGDAETHRQRFLADAGAGNTLLICGSHRVVAQLGAGARSA
ncbi:MAG: hypothetical protein BRD48_05505 [Bacteroidetes bacterium QS_9_68_14]|nr:MAG: hypothetical protein BRD48_05505 [Bacteroidetes bacterium QS_9_68_14]